MGKFITGKKNKLDKSKDILIIPRHQAALRFIELPSVDPSEIKNMAEFQAFKEVPYQKTEIITGFKNIGSYRKGFSYIMLAIVKRQQIEKMMAQRNTMPESIRLETELLYSYLLQNGMIKRDKVNLIVNIQKDYSEIMILDSMKPVFSRGLNSAEEWLDEVKLSITSYKRGGNNKEVEELVIVYSPNLDIKNIKSCAKASFSIPVNFCEYRENPGNMDVLLEINLLPKEHMDKNLSRENIRQALFTYFLLFIAVTISVSFFVFKIHEKNKMALVLAAKTYKIQKNAEQLNIFFKKTEILKCREEKGERIVNALKECYELMPQDIFLKGLDYDGGDILYCKGMTKYMSGVFNAIRIFEKSEYFGKAEVRYAARKEMGNQEFTDFSIACFMH